MAEKILELNKEKYIFWSLVGVLFLSIAFYMYCINSTVRNVVSRENIEQASSQLALEISTEEFKYISMHNAVTLQMAYAQGYKDVTDKKFISKQSQNSVSILTR